MRLKNLIIEWIRPIVQDHDVPANSSSKCYCEYCSLWDEYHKDNEWSKI